MASFVILPSVFITLLSGCSPENLLNGIIPSDDQEIQDIHPDSTRIYMDELPGTVQSFTGNKLTLVSSSQPYTFDVSQATLESEDGIIRGDSVSVIYEGQLTDTDTSYSPVHLRWLMITIQPIL